MDFFEERQLRLLEKAHAVRAEREASLEEGMGDKEALAFVVSPTSAEDFFARHWEQAPLHSRGGPSHFDGVFSLEALWESVLARNEASLGERLMVAGEDLLLCRVNESGVRVNLALEGEGEQLLSLAQVEAYVAAGYTAQVFQPQRFCNSLARVMSALESEFGCLWGANSYVTPRHSRGLAAHYDDVEVFVLQMEGRKRWRVYEPTVVLPASYSADFTPFEVENRLTPYMEVVLEPGDLLYLPRGWIHQAEALEELSHHVTLSTYQNHNFRELLSAYFDNALDRAWRADPTLRAGLPIDLWKHASYAPAPTDFSNLIEVMAQNVVHEYGDTGTAVDLVLANFVQARLPPVDELTEDRVQLELEELDGGEEEDDLDMMMDEEEEEEEEEDASDKRDPVSNLSRDDCLIRLAVDPTHLLLHVIFDQGPAGKPWDMEPMLVALHSQNNLVTHHMVGDSVAVNEQSGNSAAFPLRFEDSFRLLVASAPEFITIGSLPLEDSMERTSFLMQLESNGLLEWE